MKWQYAHFTENRARQIGECSKCGKYVVIDTRPEANGIDIGGNALALGCNDKA